MLVRMSTAIYSFLLLVLYVSGSYSDSNDDAHVAAFDVKPGGLTHSHSERFEDDDVECKFTYVAQGGTHESWNMILTHGPNGEFVCSVERPGGISYLYFIQFSMEMDGVKKLLHGEAENNGSPLDQEEYVIDKKQSSLSSVEGKFSSQLSKVEIAGRKHKKHRNKRVGNEL